MAGCGIHNEDEALAIRSGVSADRGFELRHGLANAWSDRPKPHRSFA